MAQDRAFERTRRGARSASSPPIKEISEVRVGDTTTDAAPAAQALPGVQSVFCGLFPTDAADFEKLRDSL
jgi:translation elongation factor EF-4